LAEDSAVYDQLSIEGVPDEGNERQIYFRCTFFDIKAATLHGVAACEIMAEFALFDAIRMSKDLACNISYIRFSSAQYEEINAIVLGDWPNKESLIVCPWLGERGETII
jgi:hypothetical protein